MRNFLNYVICSFLLLVAVALILSGGWWSMCGLIWSAGLYATSDVFKAMWRRFWVSNTKILNYFECL